VDVEPPLAAPRPRSLFVNSRIIRRLGGLGSLLASGAILPPRRSSLETPGKLGGGRLVLK